MASDEQAKQPQNEAAKIAGAGAKADGAAARQGAGQPASAGSSQGSAIDAITLLKTDHREVEKLFAEYEKASNRARKQGIIGQVAQMLKIHAELEETIFYPAVRQHAEADDKLDEAQVEHDTLKILIMDLERGRNSEFRDAKVKVLAEYVKHHVQEEEAGDGILEQGRKGGLDLKQLGQQMAQLKEELAADPSQLQAEPVSLQQFDQPRQKEQDTMRQGYGNGNGRGSRERDERGRFMESRGGYDDDRRSSRGRGYDDDDRRGGGGRRSSQGSGWYGDPQGHSEAARRGWEQRDDDRSSHSRSDDDDRGYYRSRGSDDDRRYNSGGRGDDQGRGGDRGQSRGGWFGDPRGHSEAARRGWDDRR